MEYEDGAPYAQDCRKIIRFFVDKKMKSDSNSNAFSESISMFLQLWTELNFNVIHNTAPKSIPKQKHTFLLLHYPFKLALNPTRFLQITQTVSNNTQTQLTIQIGALLLTLFLYQTQPEIDPNSSRNSDKVQKFIVDQNSYEKFHLMLKNHSEEDLQLEVTKICEHLMYNLRAIQFRIDRKYLSSAETMSQSVNRKRRASSLSNKVDFYSYQIVENEETVSDAVQSKMRELDGIIQESGQYKAENIVQLEQIDKRMRRYRIAKAQLQASLTNAQDSLLLNETRSQIHTNQQTSLDSLILPDSLYPSFPLDLSNIMHKK